MEEKNSEKEVIENESKQDETKENTQDENKKAETENSENTENGIEISNDVIAVIAGVAVSEVQGVASMSGGFAGGITEVLSGKKNMAKGIKVDKTENTAKIDVNIIVEYGSRIPDVAFEIQNRVKNIYKHNFNIISNSMSISIWMDRHRCSTKFSKRFDIIWNIIKNNIRSKHSIYTIIT